MVDNADRRDHVGQELRGRDPVGRPLLADDVWELLAPVLAPSAGRRGRPARAVRRQVEGMLALARAGIPWRLLPEEYGRWNVVYHHFTAFRRTGRLQLAAERLEAAGGMGRADTRAVVEALRALAGRGERPPRARRQPASKAARSLPPPRAESSA